MKQQNAPDDINAFVDVFRREGSTIGPLLGKTVAVKDLFDVEGYVTGCGNPEWTRTHSEASRNAWSVAALLGAGATLAGKTHTDELAYSLMGMNAHYGTPVNSADPRRVPGGSSSGSAAAVAAGLADLGLGTDTGGSIRMPASFCGLWGLRTTFGLVSVDGVMPFTSSFDTVGWMARDGGLMASAAEALGCPEGVPVTQLLLPVDIWARADAATVEAVRPALARLEAQFGAAAPVRLAEDGLDVWREAFRICQAAEVWNCLGAWVSSHTPEFGPGIKDRFEMAAGIARSEWTLEEARRQVIRLRMRDLLKGGAVLVMPTSPAPGPLLTADEAEQTDFRTRALEMLCPAGLSGLPQLSVPAGTVDCGPVGLSMVGTGMQDRQLIAAALAAGF